MYLDFAEHDAGAGGYVRLDGPSFWAGVVGLGSHPLVSLRDDEVPRRRGFDVRAEGLWASLTCETSGEHWSAGMEAFAVGYEDPAAALTDEIGDRVALGFDLEWERDGPLWRVHGEVLVGEDRVVVDTFGTVAEEPRPVVAGRLKDNEPFVTDDVTPVVDSDGLLAGGMAATGDTRVELLPRWHAPIKNAGSIPRALCRLGAGGVAWVG